jgi:hypothetical protein
MISDNTQEKLDRASEGLPMDDERQQAEVELEEIRNIELAKALGLDEVPKDKTDDKELADWLNHKPTVEEEMDDDTGVSEGRDVSDRAEDQLFNDHE